MEGFTYLWDTPTDGTFVGLRPISHLEIAPELVA